LVERNREKKMGRVESLRTEYKFKKTEIGKIPVDWEVAKIRDTCEVVGGSTPSTIVKEFWNGDIHWAIPTDITKLKGNIISDTEKAITEKGLSNCAARILPVGSILLTSRATIGECAINSKPMATNQGFASLICRDEIYNWFVFYRIKYMRKEIQRLGSGSTFNEVSKKNIRELKIPIPPLPEQKRIAEILLSVDEAIDKKQEIIGKTKMLKKGLMQELLTHGIGHKKFKNTEIGEIPVDWEVDKVEDVCERPEYGYTESATEKPIGPKFLRISDIHDGRVNWESVPFCNCPNSIKEKYILKSGDILFARTGATTGKSYIIKKCPEAVFASYLIRVVTKERINPNFLYLVFNSFIYWKQIEEKIGGSAQGGVNASSLSRIKVPLPTLPEQKKIAEILKSVDEEVEKEIVQKEKIENIKKGLMQVLLTGKIRVKI